MAMRTESTSNSTIEHEEYPVTERPALPAIPAAAPRSHHRGLSLPVAEAARQLGVSRMTLHRILRGEQAVTPEMALRLGKLCGNGPELWLRMQMARDLWCLERSMRADLARIPTHARHEIARQHGTVPITSRFPGGMPRRIQFVITAQPANDRLATSSEARPQQQAAPLG